MKNRLFLVITLGVLAVAWTGCSAVQKAVDTAVNQTADSAATATGRKVGDDLGNRLGESIGQSIIRAYTPQFMSLYASVIFGYAFNTGSYWIPEVYEEGEWTKWQAVMDGEGQPSTLEKAFLKRDENNNEWWKVKFYDAESDDTVILEGLFSRELGQLLRLRAKFPDREAGEMPVQAGTAVYTAPMELTEESLEGATVGTETVTVPAGTFTTKHLRYIDAVSGESTHWYLNDEVPGGIVKYEVVGTEVQEEEQVEGLSQDQYKFELIDYGTSAESELGSL